MHGKGCPVMEYTIRRTAIERPYEALSELRLPPNKNREKQARADEKRGFAGDIATGHRVRIPPPAFRHKPINLG